MPPKRAAKRPHTADSETSHSSEDQHPPQRRKSMREREPSQAGKDAIETIKHFKSGVFAGGEDPSEDELSMGDRVKKAKVGKVKQSRQQYQYSAQVPSVEPDGSIQDDEVIAVAQRVEKPVAKLKSCLKKALPEVRVNGNKSELDPSQPGGLARQDIDFMNAPVPATENGHKIASPMKPAPPSEDLLDLSDGHNKDQGQRQPVQPGQVNGSLASTNGSVTTELSRETKLAVFQAMVAEYKQPATVDSKQETEELQAKVTALEEQLAEADNAVQSAHQRGREEGLAKHRGLVNAAQKVAEKMAWCCEPNPYGGAELDAVRKELKQVAE